MLAEKSIQRVREAICLPARHEKGASPSETLSTLHPLGCSSTGYSRRRIHEALVALRSSLQSRELWDQRPEMLEELLHVHRDTDRKRKAYDSVRETLQRCLEVARTQDPFASPCAIAAARIVAAGKKSGASIHEEAASSQKGPEVSVCGTSFLVDFHLHPGERRADVKFRDIDADGTEAPSDSVVDKDFERLVTIGDFDQLEEAFRSHVKLEELDAALGTDVPLKKGLRAFQTDLINMQAAESAAGCPNNVRIQQGLGFSFRSAKGLRVAFAVDSYCLVTAEDAPEYRKLVVSGCMPTVVPKTMPVQFSFATPQTVDARAQYVLMLEKSVVVTLKMALQLEKISSSNGNQMGLAATGSGESSRKRLKEDEDPFVGPFPSFSSGVVENSQVKVPPGHVESFPSIQVLLAPNIFSPELDVDQVVVSKKEASPGTQEENPVISSDGHAAALDSVVDSQALDKPTPKNGKRARSSLKQQSEYVHGVSLPSGQYINLTHNASSLVPGITVTKVPISQPGDVVRVFTILRQQIAFNELFLSCYKSEGNLATDSTPLIRELVEVGLSDAPEYMHFGVYDARLDDFIGLGISIGTDGSLTAKLSGSKRSSHPCTDEKATEILRRMRSVPLTIQGINQISMPAP